MCKCRSHGTFPPFGLQSSHLNICYYHQDPHRRPLRTGSRPEFYSGRRALLLIWAWPLPRWPGVGHALKRHPFSGLVDSSFAPIPESDERFARQYRCGPPPEFPLASPRSGIVHHLSGPDTHAHTRTLHKRSGSVGGAPEKEVPAHQLPYAHRASTPVDSHACQAPWSVFQDGSNGEPTGRCHGHARAPKARLIGACCVGRPPRRCLLEHRSPGLLPSGRPATISASSRAANKPQPFRFRTRRTAGPHPLPSRQFQALFDSLFKVLFIFPSRYLFAIGLSPIFSLGRNLSPD
ncbi:uncharacterized protein LOC114580529 [Dendrobium catenatum]|uniref:uncharacterized protein LOC114580529 n=1 Tax=Dendrobium catenatum TaxID=906689 RepID=UPI00109FE7D6|nr:uncharacterized protein LOC114580529 [Dendrobium catenatum]